MKKLLPALIMLVLVQIISAQPLENGLQPAGFVNDYAGVLGEYEQLMEAVSTGLEQNTSAEMFVVAIKSSGQLSAKDYATEIFNKWKIGKKSTDNGLLILLSVDERRIEVETGYGLEGLLPDSKIGRILDEHAVPLLKEGKYGEALFNLAQQFSIAIKTGGEYSPEPESNAVDLLPFVPFIVIFLIIIFASFAERPPKCDACKTRMKKEKEDYSGNYATITYVCPKCKRKKKKARPRNSGFFIFMGGGSGGYGSGGGWSGGGGGSSGGGGAGRGF